LIDVPVIISSWPVSSTLDLVFLQQPIKQKQL